MPRRISEIYFRVACSGVKSPPWAAWNTLESPRRSTHLKKESQSGIARGKKEKEKREGQQKKEEKGRRQREGEKRGEERWGACENKRTEELKRQKGKRDALHARARKIFPARKGVYLFRRRRVNGRKSERARGKKAPAKQEEKEKGEKEREAGWELDAKGLTK